MRYKEYNANRVLEKATNLFWQKGFNGCSINELVEDTGVNRFSLYNEFQSKEGILYATLNQYRERNCPEKFDLLGQAGSPTELLSEFYLSFFGKDEKHQGCYFIHVGTEMADADARIRESLKDYLSEIEELIQKLLVREGEAENAAILARHLVGLFCTSMSFCLIHTEQERVKYIQNGISIILSRYGKNNK